GTKGASKFVEGYDVDEPDEDAENSHSVTNEISDAEKERREAEVEASAARAKADAADRAAAEYAQHEATMETSDPNNPQDANGNVATGTEEGDGEDFNPSEHTAAEVKEHLATTDDD